MNLLKKQLVKENYHKETLKITIDMAWPAIVESFFVAFAGLIDSLMVSSLGSYAVAAVGLTTQPKGEKKRWRVNGNAAELKEKIHATL